MKKRLNLLIALSVCVNLVLGLMPAAAANPGRKAAARAADPVVRRANARTRTPNPQSSKLAGIIARKMASASDGQTSTLLPDGRLLLIGGQQADGPSATAAIKDPRTNETVPVANTLQDARAWHSATMLPSGDVLILGGVGADGQIVKTAEIFNRDSKTFDLLLLPGLQPRAHHTATLLTDGRVLIAGGISNRGRTLDKVETWDPQTRIAVSLPMRLKLARHGHSATLQTNGHVLLWGGASQDGAPLNNGEVLNLEARGQRTENGMRGILVDRLPQQADGQTPRLEASLPEDGMADVALDARPALRFSKPLRVETVNAQTVTLTGPYGAVEAKIIPAEDGRLAFVTPQAALFPGSTYTLSVNGAVGRNGSALAPVTVSFTTASLPASGSGGRDDEAWIPDENNLHGNWRSNRGESRWRTLKPLQAPPGVTALAGHSLTLNDKPLANVTLRIGDQQTTTDHTGRFLLTEIPAGHQVLLIDGRTASTPGKRYGIFKVGVEIKPSQTNVLPFTAWMPKLDTAHTVTIPSPTAKDMVIANPRIPNLELRLPARTLIRDVDGQAVTQISMTAMPVDRPPFPLPPGVNVPVLFTVQPGGAVLIPPRAQIVYPNFTNEVAGARMNFWNYDPSEKGWYVYGQGTVTADRRQIVPDPGVAVYEFNGIMISTANRPDGPVDECSAWDGDPVSLSTGLFVLNNTDLMLPGVLPIELTRTYRTNDSGSYSFGIGAVSNYDLMLYDAFPNGQQYQTAYVIMPHGGRYRFDRITSGTNWVDAVFENSSSPGAFYKARITWNGHGWDVQLKDGTVLVFGDSAPLQAIRDRNGNQMTILRTNVDQYGTRTGNMTKLLSTSGRWIEFTSDTSNRITQARDNLGREVNYTYDASGRLWKVTDPMGGITEYSYDSSHRMTGIKNARGITYVTNEYDANGRVHKQTHADGGLYEFAYTLDGNGKVTQTDVTNPRGKVRRMTFNADGYSLTDIHALGQPEEQTVGYTRASGTNRVSSQLDPLGRSTTYAYDAMGNVTSITYPAGTADAVTTTYTYEVTFNQVASVTDPLNHTTSYQYDSNGNLISVTDALNHQVAYAYNAAGQVVSVTDALQQTMQFTYEGGDLVTATDPLGQGVSLFTDAAGRTVSATNPLGQTMRYEYDALNRLTQITDPQGATTSFTYDEDNELLTISDARGKVTSYTYDDMGRRLTQTDPLLHTETYEYDLGGNLTKLTDRRGKVTILTYDGLNRRTSVGFGAVTSGGTTTYESTISYTYDGAMPCGCGGTGGRLTEVVDSTAGTMTYDYDSFDRMTSETTPQGTVSYTYDEMGRRATMTVAGQSAVNYTYDNADRLTQIAQGSSNVGFGYDAAGRRTSITLPNGVISEYNYDVASRVMGITYRKGATMLGNLSYNYDAAGRRTQVGGSFARIDLPAAVNSTSYNDANRQTGFASQTLTYDANGNLTSDGANSYTWNARNQLVTISGTGLSASFTYDARGRRISKTVNGTTTSFVYDQSNAVQEQVGGTASANLLTGRRADEVLTRTDAAGTASLLADGLGSTIALTDSSGTIPTSYSYEPFGQTSSSGTTSSNRQKYTGREDDGTGLYYYRARYYSPTLQRFISEDPAGFVDGYNLYAYVSNSPVNLTDPSGHYAMPFPIPPLPLPWVIGIGVVGIAIYLYATGHRLPKICDLPFPMAPPSPIVMPKVLPFRPKEKPKDDPAPPPPGPPPVCRKALPAPPRQCRYICPNGTNYFFDYWMLGVDRPEDCPDTIAIPPE